MSGGSWNSANGYISEGGDYISGSGNVQGGANVYANATGQSITASADAQSNSSGNSTLDQELNKKKDGEIFFKILIIFNYAITWEN